MKFLTLLLLTCLFATTSFAAVDNIYTRANYPQPRLLDNNGRVFPIQLMYTSDGNGNVSPVGPLTVDSFQYATAVASPLATTGTTVIKAATSGTKANFISSLQVSNTGASSAVVSLIDGATVIWSSSIPVTNGLLNISFNPPLKGTASTATSFVVNSGATPSLLVSAQGFVR